jgi:basic membrane lipoprotein Med (substrate-binding protein (PBP1-ABC) superfamily)
LATKKALDEGYAKSTPLKDGTPYFMWNIDKVRGLISKDHQPLSKVDYWVNEVQKMLKQAEKMCSEGNDKLGFMLADSVYDEVPKDIRQEVRAKVEQSEQKVEL